MCRLLATAVLVGIAYWVGGFTPAVGSYAYQYIRSRSTSSYMRAEPASTDVLDPPTSSVRYTANLLITTAVAGSTTSIYSSLRSTRSTCTCIYSPVYGIQLHVLYILVVYQ